MENIYATLLAFLEMTFIFVGLCLLHSQRKIIGNAAFYIAFGLLFVFAQFVAAAGLKIHVDWLGLNFYIGSTIMMLPCLSMILLVYATEGSVGAQRLIVGVIAAFGLFFYLASLTHLQCNWLGFSISQGVSADSLNYLLEETRRSMAGATLAQIIDLFLIPVFFQRLRNAKCRLFFCVFGALVFTLIADSFVYLAVTYWNNPEWWLYTTNSFIINAIAIVWLSVLITIYMVKVEREIENPERSALDVIFAFFGGYSRAQMLEKNLREWEGRYRMVVENASEMIMLLDHHGNIIDANWAAAGIMGVNAPAALMGNSFLENLKDEQGKPVRVMIPRENPFDSDGAPTNVIRFKAFLDGGAKTGTHLDIALSTIEMERVLMLILLARDITEESRLAREKEKLSEQLAHSQRLEAIGQLAGGIAHDFNNHIHAVLGNLDTLRMIYEIKEEGINKHLDRIATIAEQAGELTRQLLGFARKGKYHEVELDLRVLVEQAVELFIPKSHKNLDLKLDIGSENMPIRGDRVQLQQVIINLLINARDATDGNASLTDKKLKVYLGPAIDCGIKLRPTGVDSDAIHPENYYCLMIKDNGIGMDKATSHRIFEPFFTTKPTGKGTGMGLAMVYGTVTNHHGWIQVKSQPGKGSSFYIFLPRIFF